MTSPCQSVHLDKSQAINSPDWPGATLCGSRNTYVTLFDVYKYIIYFFTHDVLKWTKYVLLLEYMKTLECLYRADIRLAPSQWEMSLQSNADSHWLGANLKSTLCVGAHSWWSCCVGRGMVVGGSQIPPRWSDWFANRDWLRSWPMGYN